MKHTQHALDVLCTRCSLDLGKEFAELCMSADSACFHCQLYGVGRVFAWTERLELHRDENDQPSPHIPYLCSSA